MTTSDDTRTSPTIRDLAVGVAAAAVGSAVATTIVAVVARAFGASDDFKPLQAAAYLPFTVIGVMLGSIAWFVIVRHAAHPDRLLRRLVPTVVVVSLVPDVLLGFGDSMVGVSWGAVLALVAMHLVVAAVTVTVLRRAVPAVG